MCTHICTTCTSTCDVATCVCASVWYVHIHMLHAVKTSVCGVCHYRQPCVYNSVHESHEAHTHTTQRSHSFNVSASVVCGRWRRFTCARLSIAETRASTSSVCVYVGCLRRFTLSVDCGVCACECVVAWCVSARQLHTR